jgi:hypothetical protein
MKWLIPSAVLLVACTATPIPLERAAYVGVWRAEEMILAISPDGSLAYRRVKGNRTTSIDAPLQKFVGDDFVTGVWFMTSTFKVSEPPHLANGVWKMTVDGVELTREVIALDAIQPEAM